MSIRTLQDYTYYSKYARYNKEQHRRETWNEAIARVEEMHLRRYPQAEEHIRWAFNLVREKRVLGSQRALQFGGKPVEKKHARLYNCTVSFCDRLRFFQETFWLLLCGCGVGFSVQKQHVSQLPTFSPRSRDEEKPIRTFIIPDTIEGWADALSVLLSCYFYNLDHPEWEGCDPEFDFSQIRPAGSHLASGVGKAPGSEPLRRSLKVIKEMLDDRCRKFDRLRPIDAYDVVMHASDAVLSGGVRRSASICIFSRDDEDMVKAKTGNWFVENPQRGRSNNSALLVRGDVSKEDFLNLIDSVREFGEPGFYWSDSTEQLPNPCFHRDTRLLTDRGWLRIEDLTSKLDPSTVIIDKRVGKGDMLSLNKKGVTTANASPAFLTQRNAQLYELRTTHGHSIKATAWHEFPTTKGRKKLEDLQPGDTLLLQSGKGQFGNIGNYEQGLLLGLLTSDGTLTDTEAFIDVWEDDFEQLSLIAKTVNEQLECLENKHPLRANHSYQCNWMDQTPSENNVKKKRIGGYRLYRLLSETLHIENPQTIKSQVPECVWRGSEHFVRGYLHGLFFGDGSPQYKERTQHTKSTFSLRLNQSNEELLQSIQTILSNFAIQSRIYLRRPEGYYQLPDGNSGRKKFWCKANYDLVINRPNYLTFESEIGLFGRKAELAKAMLAQRGTECRKKERHITHVRNVEPIGSDDVFCLTQYETNTVIANGCITGQCVEIGMWPCHWETEESGWQFCNLGEINGKKVKCKEDFALAARAAAIICTLQAGYTDFPYLGKTTEEIVRKESLLGVSITGMMDNPDVLFDPKSQREMAELIIQTNEWMSNLIGINPAARCTCVKPAGTTSCILGTSSGIHPHHARRYFRRVQGNNLEPVLQHFKESNPTAVDKCVWSANGTDEVVTFCVEVPDGAKTKNDISAIDLLNYVKSTQQHWVTPGKVPDRCTKEWLTHNVSNTINVRPEEWKEVADFIYKNRQWFAGISLLPQSGDLDYPQAPMVNVHTPREILHMYGDCCMLASGLIVDGLSVFDRDLWAACDSSLGLREVDEKDDDKLDWIRRVQQFADRYLDGDVRKCTYLMKEVNNWKRWLDLRREYVDVDYTRLIENGDNTKPLEEVACAGGKCELVFM